MELKMLEASDAALRAGYSCPCGCTPSVEYARGAELVEDNCCCGNHFAVGPRAGARLGPMAGFQRETQAFKAPWGEPLEAAWLVGPSTHGSATGHDHDHHDHHDDGQHGHDQDAPSTPLAARALDPVCGMTVEPDAARAKGLHSSYRGIDYFFCGRGCQLEFGDDPERYLDPAYVPSM